VHRTQHTLTTAATSSVNDKLARVSCIAWLDFIGVCVETAAAHGYEMLAMRRSDLPRFIPSGIRKDFESLTSRKAKQQIERVFAESKLAHSVTNQQLGGAGDGVEWCGETEPLLMIIAGDSDLRIKNSPKAFHGDRRLRAKLEYPDVLLQQKDFGERRAVKPRGVNRRGCGLRRTNDSRHGVRDGI
jgi:hypothetical protein